VSRAWKISLVSLGCPKNTVDSETALGELLGDGFALVSEAEDADLVLVNTCGFVESARQEAYAVIEEMLGLKARAAALRVAVMGCLAQDQGRDLAARFPELDAVFGFGVYGRLASCCRNLLAAPEKQGCAVEGVRDPAGTEAPTGVYAGPRLVLSQAYAYLRIAEGCDNRCAYCTIPRIRGPFRSRPLEEIVTEARELEEMGVRELVLVAQDTTRYGADREGTSCLARLLDQLLAGPDVSRVRVLYAHPAHLDRATVRLLAEEPRLCSYLDLPVQHVSSRILAAMNRGYGRTHLESLLAGLRRSAPGLVLRTTVMVGFPGESEAEFEELLAFVSAGHFQHLGAFGYSAEAETAAAALGPALAKAVIQERLDCVMQAQQVVACEWLEIRVGTTVDVFLEPPRNPTEWEARSTGEAPQVDGMIRIRGRKFTSGDMIRACLTRRDGYDICAVPRD